LNLCQHTTEIRSQTPIAEGGSGGRESRIAAKCKTSTDGMSGNVSTTSLAHG
jgi:hypothetical protein